MSCSTNKLKYHKLKSHVKMSCFPILQGKKMFAPKNGGGGGGGGWGLHLPCPPPFSTTLFQNKNTYECNFNLIVDNSHLFNSNMRIGTYLDQTLTIMQ